jgi:hypothetical protein
MPSLQELMLGWLCSATLALAAGCGVAPQGQAWLEVRTAHFDVHTDLIETAALDMARALEEARAGLTTLAWRGAPGPRGRTEVVVFAREARFRQYVREQWTEGLAQSRVGSQRLIVVYWDDGRPFGLPRAAVHELAHDLCDWFTPLQPAWYAEGMALFWEGLDYDREKQRATLARRPEPVLEVAERVGRRAWSAQGLFAARAALQGNVAATRRFYFSSWLLVHYLINRHPDAFVRFQRDLAALRDWREAWSARFPRLTPEQLEIELQRYLDRGHFEYVSAKVHVPPFAPRVRRLSPAEGQGLSSWIAHRLRASELSARDTNTALALDPHELNALRTRYHELTGKGRAAERRALARQLVQAHPESGEAWLLLARSGGSEDERQRALDQARYLMPDHPGVLELLAARALAVGDPAAALRHTNILIRRTALGPAIAALHLRALASGGRCDAARQFADSASASYSGGCNISRRGQSVPCPSYFEDVIREACRQAGPVNGGGGLTGKGWSVQSSHEL